MKLAMEDGEVDIDADTVILASGAQANLSLYDALASMNIDTHIVGDCGGVGYIEGAMHSGNKVGRKL